jgi:SAM-dependent methyltransferase
MIAVARRRATDERIDNVDFVHADAQVHPFVPAAFDVAISRTGASFFGDPVAAFRNIAGALRPRGRVVLLTWQPFERNEWVREIMAALAAGRDLPPPPPTAPGPFALAEPQRAETILRQAGLADVRVEPVDAPMWFGHDPDDAGRLILGLMAWMLRDLDDDGRHRAREALRSTMDAHATPDGVLFGSSAWIISARR